MPIPGTTIRHTIGSVGDIDGLWLLQIGEPVGVGFLRAVVEPYVVTSGEGTPQPEPDGRAENRAVVTEGVVFSVFAVVRANARPLSLNFVILAAICSILILAFR